MKDGYSYFVPADKSHFWAMLKSEWICHRLNKTPLWNIPKRNRLIRRLFGSIDGVPYNVQRPFHCTYGQNIHAGKNFYSNFNCVILDQAKVTIGDNCMLGPNVTITTTRHPFAAEERRGRSYENSFAPGKLADLELAAPVTIGDDVWIAAGCVICPGVTIGSGAVIGAGSVVTSDIPADTLAYGVPCRAIRPITEADRLGADVDELIAELHKTDTEGEKEK